MCRVRLGGPWRGHATSTAPWPGEASGKRTPVPKHRPATVARRRINLPTCSGLRLSPLESGLLSTGFCRWRSVTVSSTPTTSAVTVDATTMASVSGGWMAGACQRRVLAVSVSLAPSTSYYNSPVTHARAPDVAYGVTSTP